MPQGTRRYFVFGLALGLGARDEKVKQVEKPFSVHDWHHFRKKSQDREMKKKRVI